jgi:hypothetical protein
MKKNKTEVANFPLIKGEVTKTNFSMLSRDIMQTQTPLKTYIGVKAMETVIKEVLADTTFRTKVKDDYLTLSGGSLSKGEQFGAEVATVSTLKKIILAKEYEYSVEIKTLENEIAILEIGLKNKKDLLKAMKLQEINSGTAQEISVDNILNEKTETDVLDTFDLKITFKK